MNATNSTGVIAWFAKNPVAANLLMLMIIACGLYSLSKIRSEAFPSIPPSQITISVPYHSGH